MQKDLISVHYTHDKGGVLRGVSFELNGVAVRGQEVGYKGAQLREAFISSVVQAVIVPEVESPVSTEKPSTSSVLPLSELRKRNRRKGPAL